jgi:hypothetical protein
MYVDAILFASFQDFQVTWTIWVFPGNGAELRLPLASRTGRYEIVTSSKDPPKPEVSHTGDMDVQITWLLNQSTVEEGENNAKEEHTGFICDGYESF